MFEDPYSQVVLNESKWLEMVKEKSNKILDCNTRKLELVIDSYTVSSSDFPITVALLRMMCNFSEKYGCNFWISLKEQKTNPLLQVIHYIQTLPDKIDVLSVDRRVIRNEAPEHIHDLVKSEKMRESIECCLELAAGEAPKETDEIFVLYSKLIEKLFYFFVAFTSPIPALKEILPEIMRSNWKYEFVNLFEYDIIPMMRRELRAIGIPVIDEDDGGKKKE
ncbi:MAG: hypothetical protein J6S85_06660 [Methanobrevibacter sp.]|nr:hypothetical protein [Methanobrevibacter sp.]